MNSNHFSLFLVIAMISLLSGLAHSADPPPTFKITTMRDTDKVVVTVDKQKTLLDIHSLSGISHAVIERRGAEWPESMVLRLHLTGLESFQIKSGDTTLHASVSSQGGDKPVREYAISHASSGLPALRKGQRKIIFGQKGGGFGGAPPAPSRAAIPN